MVVKVVYGRLTYEYLEETIAYSGHDLIGMDTVRAVNFNSSFT